MIEAQSEDRTRRLLEVGRKLVAELDPEAVLDRILAEAREITGAKYVALGVLNEPRSELERFLTSGIDPATHRSIGELPRGRGVLGVLIDDPRPLRLADVGDHPQSYGFPAGHPPTHTFLGVPIVVRGEVWGNLYLTEKEGDGESPTPTRRRRSYSRSGLPPRFRTLACMNRARAGVRRPRPPCGASRRLGTSPTRSAGFASSIGSSS